MIDQLGEERAMLGGYTFCTHPSWPTPISGAAERESLLLASNTSAQSSFLNREVNG